VRLVVNTPTPRSGAVRDAAEIRHVAVAEGVLCLTAAETAVAAAEALDPAIAARLSDVTPLDGWVPAPPGGLPEHPIDAAGRTSGGTGRRPTGRRGRSGEAGRERT
jgi:hypothetical protein